MQDILLDFSLGGGNDDDIKRFAAKVGSGIKWKDAPAEGLHKAVSRKFKQWTVVANGIDAIWSEDWVDIQWSSKENKGYRYLLHECHRCLQ